MGSIIAGAVAFGFNSKRMEELATRFSDPKKLLDFTFPYASFTSTRRITQIPQQVFGEADVEDTWIPFFSVAANLTIGEEQLCNSGKLWLAIRSSMAFPGVFAPILDKGHVLIDGGAANNTPVDRMRELCPTGKVLGIYLVTNSPVSEPYQFGPYLSGWQALASHLIPFGKRVKAPNLFNIVDGLVYSITHYRLNETRDQADLIIDVPTQDYGLLDFDKCPELIEIGYAAAQEQLKNFKGI
jgi:predicted acylesterase/phospholipase RssA